MDDFGFKSEFNCKDLINDLESLSAYLHGEISYTDGTDPLIRAAGTIEALMTSLKAALKYVPHNCVSCKWWLADKSGVPTCTAPKELGECKLGEGNVWDLRIVGECPELCCEVRRMPILDEEMRGNELDEEDRNGNL